MKGLSMKKSVICIWALLCFINSGVFIHEYFLSQYYLNHVNDSTFGLSPNSGTLKLAKNEEQFQKYSTESITARKKIVLKEFCTLLAITLLSSLFIFEFLRKRSSKCMDRQLSVIDSKLASSSLSEINKIALCSVLFLAISNYNTLFRLLFSNLALSLFTFSFLVLISLFFIPILTSISIKLLYKYEAVIITILYSAHIVRLILDFMSQTSVDLSKMKKVSIDQFAIATQNLLKETKLDDKVYIEKKMAGSVNAALVGYGKYEHIEIYGDYKQFTESEFNAILLHEIGHDKDKSLFKKFGTRLAFLIFEMFLMLGLFLVVAPAFADETTTTAGAFIFLAIIYFCLARHWIRSVHHLVSQRAETASDMLAKSKGYSTHLAAVLFRIAIDSKNYLISSYFYNLLHNLHPTVYNRIELLAS